MLELLLKSSFAIGIAFLFYKLLLQQESFFATNRFYLIGCLALAFALPFITLPKLISHQGYLATVFERAETLDESIASETITAPATPADYNVQVPETNTQPATADPQKTPETAAASTPETTEISWGYWMLLLYLFGAGVFAASLLLQVGSIVYKIVSATDKIEDGDCVIVNTASRQAPCSFFKYIFIYPNDYDYETYEQIIAHEKIHARLGHTFDLMVAELAVIILWFNPLVWLFKREIEKNNEYQTDALLLEKDQVRKETYQLNLLQIAVPNKPLSITTNYNQSLLKQRIMMMNAKKSTAHAYWKYTFLVPLFFGTLLFMNEPANSHTITYIYGDEQMQPNIFKKSEVKDTPETIAGKSIATQPAQPEATIQDIKQEKLQELLVDKVEQKTNEKTKIKTKVKQGYSLNIQGGHVDMSEGFWYSNKEGNKYCISFKGNQNKSNWNMSDCFEASLFKKQGNDAFIVTKETGTLQLNGNLDAEVGQGKYKFTEDASFKKYLASNNISSNNPNLMFHLFFGDVDKKYVDYLKKNYNDLSGNRLLELAIHGVSMEDYKTYMAMYQKYNNTKPSLQDVISARIHGIDEAYINELNAMGYKDLSMNKIMQARIHGLTAEYVESLNKAGFKNLPIDKVLAASIHNVTPETIKEAKAMGFTDLSLDKIIELKIHGLNQDYVNELQRTGLKNLTMQQYMQAKIHGVNADFVKEMRTIDKDVNFDEIISARIHGVNKEYLDDLKKAGFDNISLNQASQAKIHGVDSEFIKKARKNGYNLNSLDKYISLKIHGMAMESLKEKD